MEEQKAQQDIRTGEALLDFNDLLRIQLKNDNVQGPDNHDKSS